MEFLDYSIYGSESSMSLLEKLANEFYLEELRG